ncbi:selenocysteine insertion sequence-binding protein 2-like [Pungitius pungitius]|uniref:selenocysteine insertion sequence-binding protein 2-like n=1 Tax=Pungitius pungitius TaxID=134920 RepID=UPI002E0EB2E1
MDKGGEPSPAARSRELKQLRKRADDSAESHTAPPTTLVSPNPYASDQSLRGSTRNSGPRRQHASDANGVPAGKWVDVSRSHGYSNSRRVRDTGDDFLQRGRSSRGLQAKASKGNSGVHAQGKVVGKNSLDAQQRGFRGARSLPNSAGPDLIPFEVKMTDFPELAVGSLGKAGPPIQLESRGPTIPSSSPQMRSAASSWKSVRKGPPTQTDPRQIAINAVPDTADSPGHVGGTSWANVASQPPKKPVPKEKTIAINEQTEETAAQREEGAPGKRKRKKKKKAKGAVEDAEDESEEPATYQELPKFEDEEEFPGLSPAVTRTERLKTSSYVAKLCKEENQRQGVQHQSADHKEKAPAEAAKKGQKLEKLSGKKSKVPVQLDIGNMLVALEMKQSQKAKPVILSVGGGLTAVQKQKKLPWHQDKIAHNPLDSTSPLVKKGKQREVPKAKKPTPLKKVILKEREERKQKRLLEERALPPECEFTPANEDDDAAEAAAAEEEEPVETKATASDEVGSPREELEDLSDFNGTDQMVNEADKEADEEADKAEIVEQQTISPVPCPASRPKIHSRKFRDYCSQMLSKDVDECVTTLLKELVRFQDRLYQKDPMKARMKRRIVMGLREVLKHLKLRKVKCVILSPNCERIQSKGGLDEALYTIIDTCREQGVPFVFALSRKALGRCVNKAVPVSLVGIFNYDGAQDFYHKMIELSSEARRAYEVMVSSLEQTGQADPEEEEAAAAESVEEKLGHDATQPEEPEYMKMWKRMLEKDCNHKFLNFESQLSSMHLDSVCAENADEDEKS